MKQKLFISLSDYLISIDEYNHEQCDRSRHGGGVLIYIKDTITNDRLDISKIEVDSLETVTIQIKPKCAKSLAIIAWHRPPKHNINDIFNIEKINKTFDKTHNKIIIMRDSNGDDLPDQDKNSAFAKLRGFFHKQYQYKQLVKKPSRTTNKSSTLLDHFLPINQILSPLIQGPLVLVIMTLYLKCVKFHVVCVKNPK